MPKVFFHPNFKERLEETIIDLENRSSVELVVVMRQRSSAYIAANLWAGICLSWIAIFLFFFTPPIYHDFFVLTGSAGCFLLGYFLFHYIAPLKRLLLPKKRIESNVEIMARAIFQKAGVYKTAQHSGLLVYVSKFEQEIALIPDSGIEKNLSPEDWQSIEDAFRQVFKSKQQEAALLEAIAKSAEIFEANIPVLDNNDSELPNTLHIEMDFSL